MFITERPEGQRIGETDGGEIEAAIDEHQQKDRPERGTVRCGDQENAAGQVAERQHFLGGKVAVGELSHDERTEDRAEPSASHHQANRELAHFQIGQMRNEHQGPHAPDGVLEKHHHRKLDSGYGIHRGSRRSEESEKVQVQDQEHGLIVECQKTLTPHSPTCHGFLTVGCDWLTPTGIVSRGRSWDGRTAAVAISDLRRDGTYGLGHARGAGRPGRHRSRWQ